MQMLQKCGQCAPRRSLRLPSYAIVRAFSSSSNNKDSDKLEPLLGKKSPQYPMGKHRSNAETLINKVPVIEVDGYTAVCDGGGGVLGHPIEYIQLNTVSAQPQVCKYCGLRYKSKHSH